MNSLGNYTFLYFLPFISALSYGMENPYQNTLIYDPTLFHQLIKALEQPQSPEPNDSHSFLQTRSEDSSANDTIKRFQCQKCPKSFNSRYGFNIHLANHTGTYSFNCLKCGYGTNNSSNFKRHQRPLGIPCGPK